MDWGAAKREYITTGISQRALADKYQVSLTAIKKRSTEEGWVDAREQIRHKTTTKLIEKASERGSDVRLKVYDAAERLLGVVLGQIDDLEGKKASEAKDVATTLRIVREILDVKSDKDLAEQEARIRKLEREAAGETQDREITVRFAEGDGWQN